MKKLLCLTILVAVVLAAGCAQDAPATPAVGIAPVESVKSSAPVPEPLPGATDEYTPSGWQVIGGAAILISLCAVLFLAFWLVFAAFRGLRAAWPWTRDAP